MKTLRRVEELKAEQKRNRSIRNVALMCCMCAIVATSIMVPYYFGQGSLPGVIIGDDPQTPLSQFPFLVVDANAKTYTGSEKGYLLPTIEKATIQAGTLDLATTLYNPDENLYCLVFQVILPDSGECLLATGLVEPGMCVENPTLTKSFERGEHNAVLRISIHELGSYEFVGSVDVGYIISAT